MSKISKEDFSTKMEEGKDEDSDDPRIIRRKQMQPDYNCMPRSRRNRDLVICIGIIVIVLVFVAVLGLGIYLVKMNYPAFRWSSE